MLKNMKIRTSLLLGFGITLLVSIIIIASTLFLMNQQSGKMVEVINTDVEACDLIKATRIDANIAARNLRNILLLPDNPNNAQMLATIQTSLSTLDQDMATLESVYTLQDNQLVEYKKAIDSWKEAANDILTAANAGRTEEAIRLVQNECIPRLDALGEIAEGMDNALNAAKNAELASQQKGFTYITLIVVGVLAVVLVIMMLFITKVIRGIVVPTAQVQKALMGFSEGRLKIPVDYQSKNEIGDMCEALRKSQIILGGVIEDVCDLLSKMAGGNFNVKTRDEGLYVGDLSTILHALRSLKQKLSSTMVQIHQAAEEVSSGADQVSSGAQALSQGATEQASSVEELAATINDISEQIKANADNAQQASQMADDVGQKIDQSNAQMQEMTAAMGEISEKSKEIAKIIKTIEDIAFQTNILALNAAVAAGKGFAVVADEVRNLSSKSADASKSTSALIEGSVKAVENGTRIATETAKDLVEVVEGAQEIVVTINRIASASKQQAEAVAQVTQGVDQISSVIQTNSATSEESAAASEELASQSTILKELVDQFTLSDEFSGGSSFSSSVPSFTGKSISYQDDDDDYVAYNSDKY